MTTDRRTGPAAPAASTPGLTRRALARRGGAAAVAAGSSTLIGGLLAAGAGAQGESFDAGISAIIGLENTLVAVYEAALKSGALSDENRELANVFARQSAEHAKLLRRLLTSAAPPRPPRPNEVAGLEDVNTGRRYIEVAGNFENQAYLGYIDALDSATEKGAFLLLSQLAASTAQHLALLREALGHVPAPSAFETGLSV